MVKGKSLTEVRQKAEEQLKKWAEQEIRRRIGRAKDDAKAQANEETEDAGERVESLRTILAATLAVDDRLDWTGMMDRSEFPAYQQPASFRFDAAPRRPERKLWHWLLPWLWANEVREWERASAAWAASRAAAERTYRQDDQRRRQEHGVQRDRFLARQKEHNEALQKFRAAFEAGESESVEEYVRTVFERSVYPECFSREYRVGYESSSKTVVVDVSVPSPEAIPDTVAVKLDPTTQQRKLVSMKKKEHEELYDGSVKQCILRTAHEVFESVDTPQVEAVVVNGWVTRLDPATGHDQTSCVISLASSRVEFEKLNLERVDADKCVKALKGLVAGPLSEVAPVKPILQLNREDKRFIEARAVLADVNSTTNLAEIPWEDFEHLVRELFSKLFSTDGAEVKVTRSSRDAGVDAVAFDPDPIRGGKFVIQAKRYTNVVPVSAVRDLYGTMINEGASKGILVTTSHYGRDSRAFAQDKPMTLIDGTNLVYLLEQHGHRVRIDLEAARQSRRAE